MVYETLLEDIDVTAGLSESGAVIVNTSKEADEIRPLLRGYKGRVCTIDARKVSMEALGMYFPNSPMLAAVIKVSGIMPEDKFLKEMQTSYEHKFSSKPEVIKGNMKALELALQEVNG